MIRASFEHPGDSRWCNSGGPMSRTRYERVRSSLLGTSGGGMPEVHSAALDFEGSDPLDTVYGILERKGIDEPEQLKLLYPLFPEPCICRWSSYAKILKVGSASDDEILKQVLWLGLSTDSYYDPGRPVLLTRTSLRRCLQYFFGRGFYA